MEARMDAKVTKREKKKGSLLARILLTPEVGVLIPILILCVITTGIKPKFMTWKYLSSILKGCVFIGAASLGQAFISIAGEIDLSVGLNGCLSGVMTAVACCWWHWGMVPCLLVGIGTGCLVGLINGLLNRKLGLHSWITTLATQFICNGLAVTISEGEPMSIADLGLSGFNRLKPLGLNCLFFIFLGLLILSDLVVRRTKFGYKLRAVGGNENAAKVAGINVDKIKIAAFVISGFFAAIGGLFDVVNEGAASSAFGGGREFRTIICVNIGGIAAGSGSFISVGLGVLLFHVLWYALRILAVDTNLQLVLIGAILVLAVILDIFRKRYEARLIVR